MSDRIKNLLRAPAFEDEDKTRIAGLAHAISLTLFVIALTGLIATPLTDPGNMPGMASSSAFILLSLSAQVLLRLGRVRASSFLLVAASWLLNTIGVFLLGGITHPFTGIYFIIILTAGLLLGGWAAIHTTTLTILAVLGLMIAEQREALLSVSTPLPAVFAVYALLFAFAAVLLYLATRNLAQAIERARANKASLTQSYHELEAIRATLEQRVADRTADMEKRAIYLRAAADVGRAAATLRDPDELLPQIAHLISERFGYYHVGIFLLDEKSQYAVLRAANSEGGQRMLARGHRLKVGEEDIVGYVTGLQEPRIALGVGEDAVHFKNPDLPHTRSEMVLPLIVGGQPLGALDVQSTQEAAFTDEDMAVLQVLADQVAITIENARLFAHSQEAIESTRRAYGEISRQAWRRLLSTQPEWGYQYAAESPAAPKSITPATGSWRPEMLRAAQASQTVEVDGAKTPSLSIPIKVRDHVVGVLGFRKGEASEAWMPGEIALLETLANRLGVALESARLFEDTQRRAVQEQMTSEITARMRETLDIESVLQTAALEIRKVLDLAEVEVRMGTQSQSDTNFTSGEERE
ncbi:MAG: GAF domain-containing protein [Anaerolineales bacterium]|nr:GAF domain-containing protein [Anaerolineales bacterium]